MNARKRILGVDDNAVNLDILAEILGGEFELLTATSGQEALQLMEQHRPELVLLDIMMPGIDGYEICRRIRANAQLRQAKVILVSAKTSPQERLAGYAAGADDYVTKPFNTDELLAKVRVFLRLRSVEELTRLKGEVLDMLAHELRTPLTGILPAAEYLASADNLDDAQRAMWGEILLHGSRRLLDLAERGLVLGRLHAQALEPRLADGDAGSLLAAAGTALQPAARAREVRLDIDVAPTLPVVVDRELLGIALRALLDSVLMLCPAGQCVHASVRREDIGCVFGVRLPWCDGELVSGSESEQFRVRIIGGEPVGGDVGMATASAIARAHGGGLTVRKLPNDLSEFALVLPLPLPAMANAGDRR